MHVDEVIDFTNSRGDSVVFDGEPYGLVSVEGLGDVEADLQTQKAPFQDGVTLIDEVLEPRYLPTEFIIRGRDYSEVKANRARLSSVLNPKLGLGTLRYISGDVIREIKAVAESVPAYADVDSRGERWQRGLVTFMAPIPYWKSPAITEEPAFEPRFRFPIPFYSDIKEVGEVGKFIMGIQRDRRIIFNDGDVPTPLQIEFHGPALNPKIINNTTGEYIKVNQMLEEDEKMMIDTTDGVKSVYFIDEDGNERNVFNWIDLGSTFFKLELGENDIEYTADSDIQGAIVDIRYNKLYVGV